MYIPDGFNSITPYLFVDDAGEFISFLKAAFNAEEILKSLGADNRIANAQLKIGNSMIMISEASEQYPSMPTAFYLYVENADSAMAKALVNNATLEMEVADMPYGDRQGGVKDPKGNIWWISQRLVDEPYQ